MNKRNILIYSAHPYTVMPGQAEEYVNSFYETDRKTYDYLSNMGKEHTTKVVLLENLKSAAKQAAQIMDLGFSVIDPLNNSHPQVAFLKETGYEDFLAMDFEIISRCDCIFLPLDKWSTSSGCKREHEFAVVMGIPIVETIEQLLAKYKVITK